MGSVCPESGDTYSEQSGVSASVKLRHSLRGLFAVRLFHISDDNTRRTWFGPSMSLAPFSFLLISSLSLF